MTVVTHGTGTVVHFTDGDDRNKLELGKLIHMFENQVPGAPMLTIGSRAHKKITPVSEFSHMEDEFMIRKSETITMVNTANLQNSATTGVNDYGCIVILDRLPQMGLFERGGIYTAVKTGSAGLESMLAYLCIAIGKEVDHASPTDKMVQFVGIDTISSDSYTYDEHATTVPILTAGASGTLTLTYAGNAGTGSVSGVYAKSATQTSLTNNDIFTVLALTGHSEGGALSNETRKKVRKIKNTVQIFKESYEVTNSEVTELMYGGDERTRRSNRKLKKLRSDIEWASIVNGAPVYDATAENPKRKMGGFGVSGTAGFIQSNNADIDSALQLTEASFTITDFNAVMKRAFRDESSAEKDFFVGVDFMTSMARALLAHASTQFVYEEGKDIHAGTRIASYRAPIGKVNFIHHPMFEGKLAKYGLLVDWKNLKIRPKRGRELHKMIDVVRSGQDGVVDEWRYEGSIEVRHENTFASIKLV